MTNFPWPFDAMQGWLEGLWQQIANQAYGAANWLFSKLWEKFNWIWQAVNSGISWVYSTIHDFFWGKINWLWDAINGSAQWLYTEIVKALEGLSQWAEEGWAWLSNLISTEWGKFVTWLENGWNWLVSEVTGLWTGFVAWIENGWNWLTKWFSDQWAGFTEWVKNGWNFLVLQFQEKIDLLKTGIEAGLEWWFTDLKEWIMGGINQAIVFLQDLLKGFMEALGLVFQGFVDWILKSLSWIARMIAGAINVVIQSIKGTIQGIISGVVHYFTSGLSRSTVDPEIQLAVEAFVNQMTETQVMILQDYYAEHSPSPEIKDTANRVMQQLLQATIAVEALGIAADQVNPAKNIGIRSFVMDIIGLTGMPGVIGTINTAPVQIGLMIPLRYYYNQLYTPMQPGASNIIRFALRECFIETRFRELLVDWPGDAYSEAMAMEGYSYKWAQFFWAAHWTLPPMGSLNEMLYRGLITEEIWLKYAKYHDYEPAMRVNMMMIQYRPYTRVDVRRMWDMRTISEADLYEAYRWLGYDEVRTEGMVLWTKVYTAFPDLIARFERGWITADQVLAELTGYGMPEDRAIELLQTRIEPNRPARVTKERDLTKSEIVKGVKADIITVPQAIELLMDLGYEEWEAGYILVVNKVVAAGHPMGYFEMKQVTQSYRKAVGQEAQEITDDIIEAEKAVKEKKKELEDAKARGESDEKISEIAAELAGLEYRLRQLAITLRQTGKQGR